MVLWQSDLRVSWRAQWLSLILHGVVMMALLLAPWPSRYTPVWLVLVLLVVLASIRSQRRIRHREGELALLSDRALRWRGQQWQIRGKPWIGQQEMMLRLRGERRRREHLWLMRDSMSETEWRQLRQQLLNRSTT